MTPSQSKGQMVHLFSTQVPRLNMKAKFLFLSVSFCSFMGGLVANYALHPSDSLAAQGTGPAVVVEGVKPNNGQSLAERDSNLSSRK